MYPCVCISVYVLWSIYPSALFQKPDIEDLLSITMDEGRAISPASECLVCVEVHKSYFIQRP